MIYTEKTKKAMKIAYQAHEGQLDKSGLPYIFHPLHVAEFMDTEESCIIALLHDVVEDTHLTMEDLEKEFDKKIIETLKILTHDKSVEYMEYIKEIKKHPIARKVKLADLDHNRDLTRLNIITEKDLERKKKYDKAIEILLNEK